MGFPGGASGKKPVCQCRQGWVQSLGQEGPRAGDSNPLQYSCLESPMDRGAG